MTATIVAMMLVAMLTAAAFAQDAEPDAGIGANAPGIGQCLGAGDIDGDGVCNNWVDADGDGANDNAIFEGTGRQYGQRGQRQHATDSQRANAQGFNQAGAFVDEDGDGTCDSFVDADGDGMNEAAPRNASPWPSTRLTEMSRYLLRPVLSPQLMSSRRHPSPTARSCPTPNFNLRRRACYPHAMSTVNPIPPAWPDRTTFWRDKRMIVTGGSGLLGSFIGDTDQLEPIARPPLLGAA